MGVASLGGLPFRTGPSEIRWDYKMKVSDAKSLGGKVIQILGVTLGDMTLTGRFGGGDPAKGDTEGWQEQMRFRDQVKEWTREAESGRRHRPIRFTYPPRNWDFRCYVKAISGITHDKTEFAPQYTVTLHLLEDSAHEVIKDIKDLYIQRLMEGVGWRQTDYNGPTEGEVADLLDGGSVGDYLASEAQSAFESGLPGGSIGIEGVS